MSTPMFNINFGGSIQRDFAFYDSGLDVKNYSSNYSSSIVNDFIPYHALLSGKLLTINGHKALTYNLDVSTSIDSSRKSYEEFFKDLFTYSLWTKLSKKNTVLDYRCRRGQLVEVSKEGIVTPLMTLVVNKSYMFDIDKSYPNPSKFFIVISNKFSKLDEHSNLYRNFCKHYLDVASKYVDVIYVNDILKFCYKQVPLISRRAKTIMEAKTMYMDMTHNIVLAFYRGEYK